ncbi:MAG TPA: FAD-dependent oxidoreductase [Steroidobacteraceae bacterium]|nr:FAD-dependent oxidoreductase [Steroidobacteraceae bacterium]
MKPTVAVVGAGMAGLVCARELDAAGYSATVFDKGKSPGGRLAARRLPLVSFDHGAQYVTARLTDFRAYLDLAEDAGLVARWWPITDSPGDRPQPDNPWFVGVPGMSALGRPLAAGLDLRQQVRIAAIERERGGWSLLSVSGDSLGPYGALVLAVPAPQALDLCEDFPEFTAPLAEVEMAACWALMLAFRDRLDVPWDVCRPRRGPLAWVARNSSKPGRPSGWDTWVLHASAEFSATQLETTEDEVSEQLLESFRQMSGTRGAPQLATAHRWRYARVTNPLGLPYVWNDDLRLGICGDWCLDARVEAAWSSARGLAAEILARQPAGIT